MTPRTRTAAKLFDPEAQRQRNLAVLRKPLVSRLSLGLPSLDAALGGGLCPGVYAVHGGDALLRRALLAQVARRATGAGRSTLYVLPIGANGDDVRTVADALAIKSEGGELRQLFGAVQLEDLRLHLEDAQPLVVVVDRAEQLQAPRLYGRERRARLVLKWLHDYSMRGSGAPCAVGLEEGRETFPAVAVLTPRFTGDAQGARPIVVEVTQNRDGGGDGEVSLWYDAASGELRAEAESRT